MIEAGHPPHAVFAYTPAQAIAFANAARVLQRERSALDLTIAALGARGKDVEKTIREWSEPEES